MGHPHPITQVCTDNITATGITKNTTKQQQSRATNMRYFGIRDEKTFKNLSFHGNQDNKILQTILRSIILKKIINVYALSIYRNIKTRVSTACLT